MSLRFIFGRGGSGKTTYCLEEISKQVNDDGTAPIILIVPEQYTFESEKRLSNYLKKDPYLRARVLSFKTLSNIVFSQVGGLTDININASGRSMMIYKALEGVSNDLEIFAKAASQPGFIGTIADMISELKQYSITYESLENIAGEVQSETLKLKLQDISKIYANYEKILHENYIDSQDLLVSLADKIESCSYFDDAIIYIDEFTGFTPNQYKVIKSLLYKASQVNISLTLDNNLVKSYNKTDVFSRTKFTEEKLRKLYLEAGVSIKPEISLNSTKIKRFEGNKELEHLERNYYLYPYKTYEQETESISIKEFSNLYSEVEQIAKEIIFLVRDKKARYRDITVVTRDLNRYDFLVQSIFNEYDIPNFIDSKKEAKSNPIIVLIIASLEMKNRSYNYETMFRYLKSGLLGISIEDISLIENYVLANGIKGKKWFEEKWNYRVYHKLNEDENEYEIDIINRVNEIKDIIIKPIINLQKKLEGKNKAKDICKYIYEFLLDINIPNTIQIMIDDFKDKNEIDLANQYAQVWEIVVDILDQIVEIMGEDVISLDKFIKVISIGFDEYELATVPPSLDQVLVSSVDRMKNPNTKHLYLMGTTDGIFPLISKDGGILNDSDRKNLGDNRVEVDIDSKTKTFEEQFLVYRALTSTKCSLTVTYPISDHEGKTLRPSIIVSRLKKIFPNIKNQSYLNDTKYYSSEEIVENITTKAPTFNELIKSIKEFEEEKSINPVWLDVYKYFIQNEEYHRRSKNIVEGLNYTNQVKQVESEKIRALYDNRLFSVSRLEKYAQCPFAYFIQYGLKAKERKEFEFTPPDFGTFVHNILDKFSKQLSKDNLDWREITNAYIVEKVTLIVEELISKIPGYILKSSKRYEYLSYRLRNMLISAISIISDQIKKGSFDPTDYEVEFGVKGKYPPIKIILENGEEINLIGQIDRIDSFSDGEEKYIRIVDYKSGNKDISLTDVYHGLQLQLLVYLDAILESAKYTDGDINPAAILYFKIDDPIIKSNEDKEDDSIREEILKKLKMKGLVLKDSNIIRKMDNTLPEGEKATSLVIPASINKDGTISKNTSGVNEEEFLILRKYVKHTIKELSKNMLEGYIGISPYKTKESTSCEFCSFATICQFDSTFKDNNYRIINKKSQDEIINKMRGEVE
ncbi:helicase-exonuclease AddAB subunit AddB [Paraclostridium ghonii]|uniref:helicase-exonuclease AddAB subunit AddB n=1 Tax=Paraclostridium ghonii TaxID=29358 RepID=UPI00202CB3FC|nr:helicase-exonuclease AddAB subunit AddB [Paeniclostridium ghonii]MCM0165621.1 helicase-exonuclease AddAB subunit AddB [Paeniclostridium ghonii]